MIRYLRALWAIFTGFSAKSENSDVVDASERISRFVLSKSHVSVQNQRVKYAAFLPPPSRKLSAYRTTTVEEQGIWEIGRTYVAAPQQKAIRGRGDLSANIIRATELDVVPERQPHKLHADVVGWPTEKDEQKMIAVELANQAIAVFPPP